MSPGGEIRRALRALSLKALSFKALSLGLERACRLGVIVAAAPVLGQAAFGRFVYASTLTALLALGTDLGLAVWTTRALARGGGDGRATLRAGFVLRGLASLPYAVAVLAVAYEGGPGEARAAMLLLGVAALVNAFVDHGGAALRGYERFDREARLNAARALATLSAGFVALAIGKSLRALCAGLAAASIVSLGVAVLTLRGESRTHPAHGEREERPRPWFDRALARAALRESLPIWVAGLLSMLYFKVDTFFLRAMSGNAELGAYGAAFKLFEGAMIVPSVLLSVTFPSLARAHGDRPLQRRLERQVSVLLVVAGTCVGALCLGGGGWLVRLLFGAHFMRALASLRVLALGLPILFLNYGLTHFLIARDRGVATQWLALAMLGVNVLLNVVLVPRAGGPGAAWATIATEAALMAGCLLALRADAAAGRSLLRSSAPRAARTDRRAA